MNQMAGPLFRELAEDISENWPSGILLTGHPDTIKLPEGEFMKIVPAPMYKRDSFRTRLLSWIQYWIKSFIMYLKLDKNVFVFLVPMPPFLDFLAYLFYKIRKQKYAVLVYDIYPDTLVNFGPLKETGFITKIWRKINRHSWQNAQVVFTIGNQMAANLEKMFDAGKTPAGKVVVVPNWADVDTIKPLPKENNTFARKHDQVGKTTVMYSGNLGLTHDIETIVESAKAMKNVDSVNFMIIGDGAKRKMIDQVRTKEDLHNMVVLDFQPEQDLPFTLTTSDISIITLDNGSEGLSVPSKTYYYMASGAALIGLCDEKSEVARTIKDHDCGIIMSPGDTEAMVNIILELSRDKEKLNYYKNNSRIAAEKFYSRNNTRQYIQALTPWIAGLI